MPVLCIDGDLVYTDAAPCPLMVAQLVARRDKQITSLVGGQYVAVLKHPCMHVAVAGDIEHLPGHNNICRPNSGTQSYSVFG